MELTFLLYLPGPDTGSTETAKTNVANAPVWRKPIRQTHTHTRSVHSQTHIRNLHATKWYAYQTAFVDSGWVASGSRKRTPESERVSLDCVCSCLLYKNIFVRLNYHQNVECYRRRQWFCSASHRDDSLGSFLLVLSGEWCRRPRRRRCRSHLTERFGWTQNFDSDMHSASYAKRSMPFVIFSPLFVTTSSLALYHTRCEPCRRYHIISITTHANQYTRHLK